MTTLATAHPLRTFIQLSLALLIGIFLISPTWAENPPPAASFRAGAAISDVTPPLGSSMNGYLQDRHATFIHDPQHVRALVLDDGQTKLAIVVVDSCVIGRKLFDQAKKQIEETVTIPVMNQMMSVTHSHYCGTMEPVGQSEPDPDYQQFVVSRIVDAVRCAAHNLEPAQIGWGIGRVPQHVFNRRYLMKEDTIPPTPLGVTTDQVKMNPGVGNPNVIKAAGPTDPEVRFLAVRSVEGRLIALHASYGLHYVGGFDATFISADYYGAFARALTDQLSPKQSDPPFVPIMANGTSGDINNVDVFHKREKQKPFEQVTIVGTDLADEVTKALAKIEWHDQASLGARQRELTLSVRRPTAEDLTRAEKIMAESRDLPQLTTLEQVYAREATLLDKFPKEVSAPIQAFRIGNIQIAAIPGEVFAEIGLEIKKLHPDCSVISLANSFHGYIPTSEQFSMGGYETWPARWSYLAGDSSPKIVKVIDDLVKELKEGK